MTDLACVSYVVPARVLSVAAMPAVNDGAAVLAAARSVGADGPVVAAIAAAHGLRTRLIANPLPAGPDGDAVTRFLARHDIEYDGAAGLPGTADALLVAVGDADGNRVWLSYLPDVEAALLSRLEAGVEPAALLYVDAYPVIEQAAVRALELARAADAPVFLNLSQSTPSLAVDDAARATTLAVVQASVGDAPLDRAAELAGELRERLRPAVAVVTAGRHGAAAADADGLVQDAGFDVTVAHAHCAGAAFSAGYVVGLRRRWVTARTVRYACALGALRVSTPADVEAFDEEAVERFVAGAALSTGRRR